MKTTSLSQRPQNEPCYKSQLVATAVCNLANTAKTRRSSNDSKGHRLFPAYTGEACSLYNYLEDARRSKRYERCVHTRLAMLQPRQNSRLSSRRALIGRLDSLEAADGTAMNAVDLDEADVCPVLVASLLPASPSLLPYCRQTYFRQRYWYHRSHP